MPDVAVIGGGLAGLTAAWRLQQRGLSYTVLEASPRLGGLIATEKTGDWVLEQGPDAFVARKPAFRDLALDLGLTIQDLSPTRHRIYIQSNRGMWPLPEGLGLLVPRQLGPFLRSPLLGLGGRIRVLAERWLPRDRTTGDESLGAFIDRRFGKAARFYLAEPLLGGIYNTDPATLSLAASFPHYRELERKFGSVTRGLRLATGPAAEGGGIQSLVGGMGSVIEALAGHLKGQVLTSAPVRHIEKHGLGYRIGYGDAQTLEAKSIILALPTATAGRLLAKVVPQAAGLSTIESTGIGALSLVFDAGSLRRELDAWGLLFTRDQDSLIEGLQFASGKWSGRAPSNQVLIRAFFGGYRHPWALSATDDQVVAAARMACTPFIDPQRSPLYQTIRRLPGAFPHYPVGFARRLAELETSLPPTIRLAGQGFHGLGVPAVVASANRAAASILG